MRLCEVCDAIPFEALPPFPQEDYEAALTGLQCMQEFSRKNWSNLHDAAAEAAAAAAHRVKHHTSIDSLRDAAAKACELCILILGEADKLLAELESLEEYPGGRGKPHPTPSFDMWLTQRPEGGRGFWVLSEPSGDTIGRVILPIATFGIVVEDDGLLASNIRGHPVKAIVGAAALERVRQHIVECDREHDECHQRSNRPVPQRLLDLQASKIKSNETVQLVELGDESHQSYAALTYESDLGIARCLETDMLLNRDDIQIANLPKTFQDAILVTRTLGLRYLWIDSLCIPGSLTEWQRSSPQAGSVYTNAYVTISATGATDALGGLFFPRPEPIYAQIPYRAANGEAGSVLVSSLPIAKEVIRSRTMEMEDEPISRGIWSFQERVLSSRVVHFASDQVYVECIRQFVSEDGLLERQRYHTTAETIPNGTRHSFSQALVWSPKNRWFDILWDYSRREPAIPEDKLTALSNVARAFQRMLGAGSGEYIAGHWKDSLMESLCWQSMRCKPSGDSNAPPWSWLSVDGIPAMGFASGSHHNLATVVTTHVSLQDPANPFGRVTAASITLEAPPLIPLQLMEENEFDNDANIFGRVYLRSESGSEGGIHAGLDTIDRRLAISANTLREMNLFALVLVETYEEGGKLDGCDDPEGTLHGLIVTPGGAVGENKMRRVGFFLADREDLGPGSLFDKREITILC